jgi:hypothetical protein
MHARCRGIPDSLESCGPRLPNSGDIAPDCYLASQPVPVPGNAPPDRVVSVTVPTALPVQADIALAGMRRGRPTPSPASCLATARPLRVVRRPAQPERRVDAGNWSSSPW